MRRRLQLTLFLLPVLVLASLSAAAAPALAVPTVDGEFDLTETPARVARGPDGNMWVTLGGGAAGNDVARVTPEGVVTEFDVALLEGAIGIAAGPDGNLWVTRSTKVARFAPANPAGAVEFSADIATPQTIVMGPDGNLWTASADKVLRITPAGVATPFTVAVGARGIASSGDLLWVADFGGAQILSVTTAGVATPVAVGGGPQEVAAGPAGQVAYANPGTSPQTVGRLTAGGAPLTTPTPGADPFGVARGADGAYWFAQFASNDLGRLTPAGDYTRLGGFAAASGPRHIAAGPGNTLWVTLEATKKVARVTGVDPAPPPDPGPPVNAIPRLTDLSLTRNVFRVGAKPTPRIVRTSASRRGSRVKAGTRIRFRLSEAATVTLRIQRKGQGRRRGGKCVKPTTVLRRRDAKRCVRWLRTGTLVRQGKQGRNVVAFSGRIGPKRLPAGRYRLTAVARDRDGARSVPKRLRFRIVR